MSTTQRTGRGWLLLLLRSCALSTFSIHDQRHFLSQAYSVAVHAAPLHPGWRPVRPSLANFVKNIGNLTLSRHPSCTRIDTAKQRKSISLAVITKPNQRVKYQPCYVPRRPVARDQKYMYLVPGKHINRRQTIHSHHRFHHIRSYLCDSASFPVPSLLVRHSLGCTSQTTLTPPVWLNKSPIPTATRPHQIRSTLLLLYVANSSPPFPCIKRSLVPFVPAAASMHTMSSCIHACYSLTYALHTPYRYRYPARDYRSLQFSRIVGKSQPELC